MKKRKHHDYPIEVIFDWNPEHIIIPIDWTPTQAEIAVTILHHLEEKIWILFGDAIIEMEQRERIYTSIADAAFDKDDPDNDIPF